MTPPPSQKFLFFKQHIGPGLLVFLIPLFAVWFFGYAERRTDAEILTRLQSAARRDTKLSPEAKAHIVAFHRAYPPSKALASSDPKLAPLRQMFEPASNRYATFRWMKRIAWLCLGAIGATFLIVGVSVAFSLRSQAAQYYSLRLGWPVLRTAAAIQVLGQSVLAVALSFWVTAILTHSYYLKLIFIIGALAVVAVIALFKAIFAKVDHRFEIDGEIISEADAPALWQRVREMAARLNTPAPDRIVAGIEPSFFVTEHPVMIGQDAHQGRTLYVSLPMLRVLAVDEADAVLGHELAHFSGEDTLWSRKVSPLLGKFALYLETLGAGLAFVVAHFMLVFWKLYGLSIRRLSRAREFRADAIGAELASAGAMKRALVKITSYCEFRFKTEQSALEKERVDAELNLSRQLNEGYAGFLQSFASTTEAVNERVPHPFDTHPTLSNRLVYLGFDPEEAIRDTDVQRPVESSWYDAIIPAPRLEEQMWSARQDALQACHRLDLAWRLLPSNDEEAAAVLEFFPHAEFQRKDGAVAKLDYDRLELSEWGTPIYFKDIELVTLDDSWGKKRMMIGHRKPDDTEPTKTRLFPREFVNDAGELLAAFENYYSRYKTAEVRSREPVAA